MAKSGFADAAGRIMEASKRRDANRMAAAVTNEFADAVALIGPASRCIERLAAYRENGADVVILVPNAVSENYASAVRKFHKAFAILN